MNSAAQAVESVLGHEGGYANDPADSGGETNWGITARVARAYGYTGRMVDMTREQAKGIYLARFWHTQRLDEVAAVSYPIALEVFDTGVNLGETAGATILQRVLNVFNQGATWYPDTTVDGRIGPMTIAALSEYARRRGEPGLKVLLMAMNCLQGAFYVGLAEKREKDERFVYGWLANRVRV